MSDLIKSTQILKLAMIMQNSHCGVSLDDIQSEFECSRRTAQRMKNVVMDQFYFTFEEVELTDSRKKRWRLHRGTVDKLVRFTEEEIFTLEQNLKYLENDSDKKVVSGLVEKLKIIVDNQDKKL